MLDPLRDDAAGRLENWLAVDADGGVARLEPIILSSGDPDDLTVRAARLLGQADRVYHRPDVPAVILDRARADAARIVADGPPDEGGDGLSLWLDWG